MARARAAAPGDESARALCEGALALVVEDVARYQLGKTKVFFRAFLLEALEQRFLWQNRRELSAPIAPRPLPCTFLRRHADTWEAAAAPSRASWCRRDPRV